MNSNMNISAILAGKLPEISLFYVRYIYSICTSLCKDNNSLTAITINTSTLENIDVYNCYDARLICTPQAYYLLLNTCQLTEQFQAYEINLTVNYKRIFFAK